MKNIISHIEKKFGLPVESQVAANVTYVKVLGLDNYSLARWISEEFDEFKVYVKQREGYKIHQLGWVKVEPSDKSELILTNDEFSFN